MPTYIVFWAQEYENISRDGQGAGALELWWEESTALLYEYD